MQLRGWPKVSQFCQIHSDARPALESWVRAMHTQDWDSYEELCQSFSNCKFVAEMAGYVFKIRGNRYRLLADIDFVNHRVLIMRIGTHEEYDHW